MLIYNFKNTKLTVDIVVPDLLEVNNDGITVLFLLRGSYVMIITIQTATIFDLP